MGVSLIIAAGGSGKRFQKAQNRKGRLGKLFFSLGGKPLLRHTLDSFCSFPAIREILVAVPPGTEKWVKNHVLKGHLGPTVRLVRGGRSRAESVWNALRRSSPENPWVMVHDGARPFPPRKAVLTLLKKRGQADGFVLARPVVPTLKRVSPTSGRILGTVDRAHLFEAETPQLMSRASLMEAYRRHSRPFEATDEASLLEAMGKQVKVLKHSGWNGKITTPEDFHLAEAYYASGKAGRPVPSSMKMGFGRDTHRLVEGRRLYLGGVPIASPKGALGHSDGDALLHAISDAVLGAIGAGDIGEWFSDRDPRTKNIRSGKILKKVLEEARQRHWVPSHVDSCIVLERPRLGPCKRKIRRKVAGLLGLEETEVSIKAKTMEGLGPEGEGLAVTCEALVEMRREV